MVICKYYLTNCCNFGSQCKNEHINVAAVVKADAEAAIKGKQWIQSSYGPFKDKRSLPNFEDLSFEEVRAVCYEAKLAGTLQAILPQLSQQVVDANYKKAMLCDTNHVNINLLSLLVNLYNSGESTVNNQASSNSGNPFAISSNVSINGQSNSIFGNTNTPQKQNPFGGSLFGSAASSSTNSTSIFGAAASNNNFFAQPSTGFGESGTSVFSSQNTFGGNSNGISPNSFGQASSSTFSLSQIGQSTESAKPSSIFGASQFQQTQNAIFGAAPGFSNQITHPTKPSGLFSSANALLPTNSVFGTNAPGLFGQTNTNYPVNNGSLFGSSFAPATQPQQSQGNFGSTTDNNSIFGQSVSNTQSIFGINQQQAPSSSIFGSAIAQQPSTQTVFGVQSQEPNSIFHQPNSNAPASNIFQNQMNAPTGGSIFGGNSGFNQTEEISPSAFSALESLTPADLEWFRADAFKLGKIPNVLPPQEVCV